MSVNEFGLLPSLGISHSFSFDGTVSLRILLFLNSLGESLLSSADLTYVQVNTALDPAWGLLFLTNFVGRLSELLNFFAKRILCDR